jgi:hypothetical protein
MYHAHPSAIKNLLKWYTAVDLLEYNVRKDGCMKNYKTKSKFICKMHYL